MVVAIIGLLALNVMISIGGLREKARIAAAQRFEQNISHGLEPAISYNLNEGSGVVIYDGSGNNRNGSLVNMDNSAWKCGSSDTVTKEGCSLYFDGVDDYLFISDDELNGVFESGRDFTVSVWIYKIPDKLSPIILSLQSNIPGFNCGLDWVFYGVDSVSSDYGFLIEDIDNLEDIDNCSDLVSARNAKVPHNKWIFGTIVYQNGNLYIYADGNLVNSNLTSNTNYVKPDPSKADGLVIGTAAHVITILNSVHHFTGYLDNIHIYDHGLTQSEVKRLYVEGLSKYQITQK